MEAQTSFYQKRPPMRAKARKESEMSFEKSRVALRQRWIGGLDKRYPDITNRQELIDAFDALMNNPDPALKKHMEQGGHIGIGAKKDGVRGISFCENDDFAHGQFHNYDLGKPE